MGFDHLLIERGGGGEDVVRGEGGGGGSKSKGRSRNARVANYHLFLRLMGIVHYHTKI